MRLEAGRQLCPFPNVSGIAPFDFPCRRLKNGEVRGTPMLKRVITQKLS